MRTFVAVFALFLFAKPILPVLEYGLRYNYISTQLCENSNKPELNCNGKCYLTKQLAQNASEADKSTPTNTKKIPITYWEMPCVLSEKYNLNFIRCTLSPKHNFLYSNLYQWIGTKTFFHPPAFI